MPCLILLSLLISVSLLHIEAAPTYVHTRCSSTGNFTPNSLYHTSLKHLLASLSSNANTTHFFYNTTATATAAATAVYGLFLCRGDVDEGVCQSCVPAAAEEIVNKCPIQKEAIIWYEECMLRYSNRSFFGAMDENPNDYLLENSNKVDANRFNKIVAETLREAAEAAAAGGQGDKKFATREANFSDFHTIYSLVECTPDLSSRDCSRCLYTAIAALPTCCSGEDRVTYLYPSCYLRYDKYRFYNQIVAPTPSPPAISLPKDKAKTSTLKIVAIAVPTAAIVVLILIFGSYCFRIRRGKKKYNFVNEGNAVDITSTESFQCDLATIEAATNNFSLSNKLGQGGFGEVYKGILSNGQEIAVKRLWRSSAEKGVDEFKNEAVLLAKLQHKNLARLLGFCLAGEEKLLVYEFVPNKSLDNFIFDPRKQGDLSWSTRHRIIAGIAKGILYLHEDSRLRIIHRDLKPDNILLDADYEPKISDFGLARLFAVDQTRADTSKVAGTLGYMSPEYALHGRFSLKSDVYSFGIIILEIISGKRNTSFIQSQHDRKDFLSHAWKLWEDGTPWKLLDQTLLASYSENEVSRCVHMGLLCVQEDPEDRPKMATIVLMLNTSSITLPLPHKPVYYSGTKTNTSELELMLHQPTGHEIPHFFSVAN